MSGSHPLDDERAAAIERWLVRRGVPHFIATYSASRDVFTRAIPVITLVFLAEVLGAARFDWSWWANALAISAGFGILLGAWALANRARNRPALARPQHIGVVELGVFVVVPALLPAIFGGQFADAMVVAGVNLALIGVVYAVTSYGLVPMSRWAVVRLVVQLGDTFKLFTRGLPLLLVAFTFLFINAEVWQVAGRADVATLVVVLGLFLVLGAVFIVSRMPRELAGLPRFGDRAEIAGLVEGTPAEGLAPPDPVSIPALDRRQWGNVGLVVLFTQALRVLLAGLLVGGFFLAFGVALVDAPTVASWTTTTPDVLASFELAGRVHVLTAELLRVSTLLAGFAALYFTVYLTTDATFREEFFDDIEGEIRQTFAVRAVYLAGIDGADDPADRMG